MYVYNKEEREIRCGITLRIIICFCKKKKNKKEKLSKIKEKGDNNNANSFCVNLTLKKKQNKLVSSYNNKNFVIYFVVIDVHILKLPILKDVIVVELTGFLFQIVLFIYV